MTYHIKVIGLATALALSPMAALAATVDIKFQTFGSIANNDRNFAGAITALDTFIGNAPMITEETFDGFTACPAVGCASSPSTTSVGNFTGITPADSGEDGSQVAPFNEIVVRSPSPNAYGRYNVTGTEDKWLDSNDMNGINWEIPGASSLSKIVRIAFFLTDVDDVGNVKFDITASGTEIDEQVVSGFPSPARRPNGELLLVTMGFSEAVNLIDIRMTTGTGDGFGMDGIKVATVPLPAAGWLMIAGLGGLAALRRRKRAA